MFTIKNRKVSKFKLFLGGILLTSLFLFVFSFSQRRQTTRISAISSFATKAPSSIEKPQTLESFGLRPHNLKINHKEEIYRRPFSKPSIEQNHETPPGSPAIVYYNQTPSQNSPSMWYNFKVDSDLHSKKDIEKICKTLHKNISEEVNLKDAYAELNCSQYNSEIQHEEKTWLSSSQYFGGSKSPILEKNDAQKTKKNEIINSEKDEAKKEEQKDDKVVKEQLNPKNLSILISSCNQDPTTASEQNLYVWLLKSPDLKEAYLVLYSPAAVFLVYKFTDAIAFADNTQTFLQLATMPIPNPETESATKECLVQTLNLKIAEKPANEATLF